MTTMAHLAAQKAREDATRAVMLSLLQHIEQAQCNFAWRWNFAAEYALSIAKKLVATNYQCMSDKTVAHIIDGVALMADVLAQEPVSPATRKRLQRIARCLDPHFHKRRPD